MDTGQIRTLEGALRDRSLTAAATLRPGLPDLSAESTASPLTRALPRSAGGVVPAGTPRQDSEAGTPPPSTAVRLSLAALASSRALTAGTPPLTADLEGNAAAALLHDRTGATAAIERIVSPAPAAPREETLAPGATPNLLPYSAAAGVAPRSALELMPLEARRLGLEPLHVQTSRTATGRLPAEDVLQAMPRRPGVLTPRYFNLAIVLIAVAGAVLLLAL